MDVVLSVRCVEHLWSVVRVLLFSDAHVDSDVSVAQRIVFECDVKFMVLAHSLQKQKLVKSDLTTHACKSTCEKSSNLQL